MTHPVLSKPERDALFTLIHFKDPATNNDLGELAKGVKIEREVRTRLEALGLITSVKETRPRTTYYYELKDAGWEWVERELAAAASAKADRTARVDYPMFNRFAAYLRRTGTPLSELFIEPDAAPGHGTGDGLEDAEAAVLLAYEEHIAPNDEWLPLARLREVLKSHSRREVDAVLESLFKAGRIRLIAEVDRSVLTQEDRRAALFAGGEDKHLMRVESR